MSLLHEHLETSTESSPNASYEVNQNATPGDDLMNFTRYQVAVWLNVYSTPIIAAISFVCNSATFVTMMYLKPITTSSIFVASLAITDTTSIFLKLLYIALTNADVQLYTQGCVFFETFGSIFVQYSNWVVVLMTTERFVAIWFPFRVSETITRKRVVWALAILGIVLFLINMHFMWTYMERYDVRFKYQCSPKHQYIWYIHHIWYWINVFVFALAPCLILSVLNGLIIARLRKAFEEQRNLANSDTSDAHRQAQLQLTCMLVVVSVSLVVMLAPLCVFHLVSVSWNYKTSLAETATYFLVQQSVFAIANLSHAVNFVFYFLSSRKFRRVFARLIRCQSRRIPMYSVSRTGNNRSMVTTTFITRTSEVGTNKE